MRAAEGAKEEEKEEVEAAVIQTRSDSARPIFTNRSYAMDWFLVPWLRRTTLASLDSAERGVL